jgi:hypothetical protein
MNTEALQNLMAVLHLDCRTLAERLGGRKEHYEQLRTRERLPFPVWDALQRLAHREGYAWDDENRRWRRLQAPANAG